MAGALTAATPHCNPMHPLRPIHRPNPAAIARRQAIHALILETLGSAAIGATIALILFR
jgi:hypothetical protein